MYTRYSLVSDLFGTHRRYMEPPDGDTQNPMVKHSVTVLLLYIAYNTASILLFDSISFIPKLTSLRLRGGAGDPSSDKRFNEIPYLRMLPIFALNGMVDLQLTSRGESSTNLTNGLGSILQSGATLLMTVNEVDPGGNLGNPIRAAAPQNIIDKSNFRNNKAFCCILNYINSRSFVYKMLMRDFVGDGLSVYRFITVFGPLYSCAITRNWKIGVTVVFGIVGALVTVQYVYYLGCNWA